MNYFCLISFKTLINFPAPNGNTSKFIRILCLFLLLLPCVSRAEEERKILLINSAGSIEKYKLARDEFKKTISYPVAEIDLDDKKWNASKLKDLVEDKHISLVYCIGSKAYLAAIKYGDEKNIIFSSGINWRRLPMKQNTFVVSDELNTGMQLTLFRYIFPELKRIGVLYSRQYTSQWFMETREAAAKMQIDIVGRPVTDSKQTLSALKGLLRESDVVWLIPDPVVLSEQKMLFSILKECQESKKAVFSFHRAFAAHGTTLIVSVDDQTVGRQAANIATRLLTGKTTPDKVQWPAGSDITLNQKRAKEYGLKSREGALSVVNRIIDY
ncbi:MAG: hypothetical protein HQK60_04105 [Deltaproteobacteria bacterium]|nr:hypothetical protein [Deltaproteobacteria bacterium]